ncbi:MAG TPA: aminotransferase class IV [Gaiella sp.]|nr:aminotransferase class IV [Gaiella sp.]
MSGRPVSVAVSGRGLVPPDAGVVSVDDEGFSLGRAAFETLRVYSGRPFRLTQHLDRLDASVEKLGFEPSDRAEVEELVALVLEEAGLPDAVLRLYRTPGAPGEGPLTVALVSALPDWLEDVRARGQRLVSLVVPRRSAPWLLPGTKSVSYATHAAASAEAHRRGADDAVFVDPDGTVLEGTVTNVWWRQGSTLFTPALALGILAGETRAALLELAPGVGYAVETGAYPLERLRSAEEVFTSSSVREVMPVVALDDAPVARGPAADELQDALRRIATGAASLPA